MKLPQCRGPINPQTTGCSIEGAPGRSPPGQSPVRDVNTASAPHSSSLQESNPFVACLSDQSSLQWGCHHQRLPEDPVSSSQGPSAGPVSPLTLSLWARSGALQLAQRRQLYARRTVVAPLEGDSSLKPMRLKGDSCCRPVRDAPQLVVSLHGKPAFHMAADPAPAVPTGGQDVAQNKELPGMRCVRAAQTDQPNRLYSGDRAA
ncbi:hypothetical protein NDU88_004548 [Pleurodeles waltl]|uniref:Uncharacterized protein n=1 Tax=Pleurodeles waltl TaxID=8319 RepID=A0AAV7PH17_PLEWA|nr:hypothetical protein NDU88_004548 [Pleurodeles waltl]